MELFAVSGLINGFIAISFGILVIAKNWRERANQLFFLMTISLAVWSLGYWQWLSANEYDKALLWVRVLSIGSLFIPVFFFHWVITFLKRDGVNKIIALFSYLAAIVISFTVNTQFFIAGLEKKSFFNFWPNSGLAYDIYFSYIYVGLIIYSIFILVYSYYTYKEIDRRGQILFIIIGALLGFGGGLTNFPLWWGVNIPPYGNFLVATFPFLLGYSVIKYRLFNAKTIATELLVFFIAITLIVQTILADSLIQFVLKGIFALTFSILGYLMIRSVYREVEHKEKEIQHRKEVEKLNKQQESLIHVMNHQIKDYLGKAKNVFAELLAGDYGVLPGTAEPLLKGGLEQMTKGVDYVQGILRGASAVTGTLPYDMKLMDARQVAEAVITQEKPTAEEKGLSFESNIAADDYGIVGDAVQLGEVFKNLIANAVKYNTPNGSVKVDLRRENGKIIFSVKDTGLGVSDEDKPKLFTVGGMGKNSIKVNVEAAGFGLAFVKGVAEAHKGIAGYKPNDSGKGSTFFVDMPAGEAGLPVK